MIYIVYQKHSPTLARCSFNKRFDSFGKQHQHTFRNDVHIQLSLSLHFYLIYLLLNSHDENDAFWSHCMLVKQSSSFSRKHRTLSLQIYVCQTRNGNPSTTEFGDWRRNVYIVQETCPRHQRLDAAHQRHMGKHIIKRWNCWSVQKVFTFKRY